MSFGNRLKVVVLIIFNCFIIPISAQNGIIRNPDNVKFTETILGDIPRKSDLDIYVQALNRTLNFCSKNKNEIDINVAFGLFLVNVNLKRMVKFKEKVLPVAVRQKLNTLVKKNDKLLEFFHSMVKKDKDPTNDKNKLIVSLFNNETQWVARLQRFAAGAWKMFPLMSGKKLEQRYSKWNKYMKDVSTVSDWVPKPHESDVCMADLAKNPTKWTDEMPKCKITDTCYDIVINGSDFGYALSHRLLLMLMARFGRGCVLFTPILDREVTRRFCTAAYGEAEYITMHGYQIVDLLAEQMLFCALDGHSKFLRRTWMVTILNFQTPDGCFSLDLDKKVATTKTLKIQKWKFMKGSTKYDDINGGTCNGHFTAVMAATMSTAARLVVDHYYHSSTVYNY